MKVGTATISSGASGTFASSRTWASGSTSASPETQPCSARSVSTMSQPMSLDRASRRTRSPAATLARTLLTSCGVAYTSLSAITTAIGPSAGAGAPGVNTGTAVGALPLTAVAVSATEVPFTTWAVALSAPVSTAGSSGVSGGTSGMSGSSCRSWLSGSDTASPVTQPRAPPASITSHSKPSAPARRLTRSPSAT